MINIKQLHDKLLNKLKFYKKTPFDFFNSIQLLSLDIFKDLEQGKISFQQLSDLTQSLCTHGLYAKGKQLKNYLGCLDSIKNTNQIKNIIQQMIHNLSFDEFAKQIESIIFGIVLTAHPTFYMSKDLTKILLQIVLSHDEFTEENKNAIVHKPDQPITLNYEHKASLLVITNIQKVLSEIYAHIFTLSKQYYPKQWYKLTPRLLTIASWVGYDLDGRTDITWNNILYIRTESAVLQLNNYIEKCEKILKEDFKDPDNCYDVLKNIHTQLCSMSSIFTNEMLLLSECIKNPNDFSLLSKLKLSNDKATRLVDPIILVEQINKIFKKIKTTTILSQQNLFVLRAEIMNYGFGMSHIHMRADASSLHNAICDKIYIKEMPKNVKENQHYIEALNKLLTTVTPIVVNLDDIVKESNSAKRLFMIVAYILKYIDAVTPIRFLISTVENSCSILTALYYAKLFDVEDKIDISPLFETEIGVDCGANTIETLLNNHYYYSYIQTRKKLCLQTGFSDLGRYIGQVTATLSLEQLRTEIANLFVKYNLNTISLLIFDTHGESIGRGGNPKNIDSRIDYIFPTANSNLFKKLNISFIHETSFQGGDGYLYFKNKELALSTILHLLQKKQQLIDKDETDLDPFYIDKEYYLSFISSIKQFHKQLFNDPDYAALINIYHTNMLYAVGSRPNKRQHEIAHNIDYSNLLQTRAITYNTILQQRGFLLNAAAGLGEITQKYPNKFIDMYKKSKRFRSLMYLVSAANQLSSFDVFDSYIELLNPKYLLNIVKKFRIHKEKDTLLKLSAILEMNQYFAPLKRIIEKIHVDEIEFHEIFAKIPDEFKEQFLSQDSRECLNLLHTIRLALMQQIFFKFICIKNIDFVLSDINKQNITEMFLHLDIISVLNILRPMFANHKNANEYQNILDFIENAYNLIRQISIGISYLNGAIG